MGAMLRAFAGGPWNGGQVEAPVNSTETGASLELRLERIKRLGNLRLDHLKRFYNWQSIAEGYAQGRLEFHTHGQFAGVPFCGRYLVMEVVNMPDENEIVVLVQIAQSLKVCGPFASVVRLQPLDCCDMGVGETFEVAGRMSLEAVWRRFDRKLCISSLGSAIQFRQAADQVIQGRPKTVGDLADQDLKLVGDRNVLKDFSFRYDGALAMRYRSVVHTLDDRRFSLSGDNLIMDSLNLFDMFPCPVDKGISCIE